MPFRSTCRNLVASAAFAAVGALALPATADDTAGAEALFTEAKELASKGEFAAACPKFEASLALGRTLGTMLNLADCLEKVGKLASAKQVWDDAAALAKEKGDERAAFASDRAGAIASRVPKLTLKVTSGAEQLGLTVAGKPVPETKWGLPMEVDPGKVEVGVLRGSEVLETKSVDVAESASSDLALDLGAIALAHPKTKKKAPTEPPSPAQMIIGWVTLGVGLGGLTGFGVLEGMAFSQRAEANGPGGCVDKGDGAVCSPQGYDLVQRAGDFAEVGQWLGVGGALAFGVGLTLVLTAPSGDPEEGEAKVAVVPWLGADGAGVVVGGRF